MVIGDRRPGTFVGVVVGWPIAGGRGMVDEFWVRGK